MDWIYVIDKNGKGLRQVWRTLFGGGIDAHDWEVFRSRLNHIIFFFFSTPSSSGNSNLSRKEFPIRIFLWERARERKSAGLTFD